MALSFEFGEDKSLRESYRLMPRKDDPISLKVAGVAVKLINISADGVAFHYEGTIRKAFYPIELEFKLETECRIRCQLKMVRRQSPNFSGTFVEMSEDATLLLARFLMNCQKKEIRNRK